MVVAVLGLSPVAFEIAAPDDVGIFPVSSIFFILDFKSSNSSHSVVGAVVDNVDSVPSAPDIGGDDSSWIPAYERSFVWGT